MTDTGTLIRLMLPVAVPIAAGIVFLTGKRLRTDRKASAAALLAALGLELALVLGACASGGAAVLWQLTDTLVLALRVDGVGRLFSLLTASVWLLVGLYSVSYMAHDQRSSQFFGWYLIVEGVLIGLDFSGNLVTMYVFYELMTLTSLPLVLHERTHEAVMAGLKYLFYSVAGAFLALFGIFFLAGTAGDLTFVPGGMSALGSSLGSPLGSGAEGGLMRAAVFCMLIGFGAKAGMFPLHGWLPTAHPAAPSPASAVLSGVITKSGVLAVIRVIYFVVGPEMIRGTWVQQAWICLTLLTVFLGSMMAYKEPVLKKRLAYSTVSQVSYILFGLSLLEPTAFVGALSHIVFHSLIKNVLFLSAGAVILITGWKRVEEMRGLGSIMPAMLGCYTLVSLGLVGIPPFSGFVSKWYLASGALASGTGVWEAAGPAVLLVSALLTAGYLLPLAIQGFLPGAGSVRECQAADPDEGELAEEGQPWRRREPSAWMLVPAGIMTAATLALGLFPGPLVRFLTEIAQAVL